MNVGKTIWTWMEDQALQKENWAWHEEETRREPLRTSDECLPEEKGSPLGTL